MVPRLISCVLAVALSGGFQDAVAQDAGSARRVQLGLMLVDLTEVNGAEQTISADILMTATWSDPELAGRYPEARTIGLDDVWHPTLLIYNQRSVSESLPREVVVQPDGTVGYAQRFTGTFSSPMDLRDFPLDSQEFYVWLVSPQRLGSPAVLTPREDMATYSVDRLSVSDWTVDPARLEEASFQAAPGAPLNPGIKLTFVAHRKTTYYVIQVLIPLVAIVMMAYAVFWVAPTVIPTRVGVVVTTMLTLIAYRFMLANLVPRLSYLTRFDWFMLGATVIVSTTLAAMAGTAYLMSREREDLVRRIDRWGRTTYPIAFAAYSLIVWLT
jgi:hypothetical protein